MLEKRLAEIESSLGHLDERVIALAGRSPSGIDEEFIAEAVCFRLYRLQEGTIRSIFLHSCVKNLSLGKKRIRSVLNGKSWESVEDILKAGNRFLDWGHPANVLKLSDLVFEDGFPVSEIIRANQSSLVDLQRVRNFIAHDSREARSGFVKAAQNYIPAGSDVPLTAGRLLLMRRKSTEPLNLRTFHTSVCEVLKHCRAV